MCCWNVLLFLHQIATSSSVEEEEPVTVQTDAMLCNVPLIAEGNICSAGIPGITRRLLCWKYISFLGNIVSCLQGVGD